MIVGHLTLLEELDRVLSHGKVPHSFLLHGPQGIGKRLIAEQLAKCILCGKGGLEPLSFDDTHPLYPQIAAGASPDYLILAPEEGKKSIGVLDVRKVLDKLALSSDGARCVIVDSADIMTLSAANALLKTLEEPGDHVHLILLCHNLSKLLPTIVSRCRQYRVSPLTPAQTSQVLEMYIPEAVASISPICEGQPGVGIALHDSGKEALDIIKVFAENPQEKRSEISQIAETLHGKKQAVIAMDLLLSYLTVRARKTPDLAADTAAVHQKISNRLAEMDIYNISPQLALEASLLDVVSLTL